jgi:hypothetical protein
MPTYTGEIEQVRYSTILGWASNIEVPEEALRAVLKINGECVAETATDADHRFELIAPVHVMSSTDVRVSVRDSEGSEVRELVWGESERPLPSEWKNGSHFRLPSFFVVGAAKSGTTSLHVYLDQHPDIFMSKPKEPFFFEAEYGRGPEYYYRRYFGGWRGEREVGESRHRNLYMPYIPARIQAFNPQARIIAILRNPAARAISHWWHWYARGKESLPLFEALQADLERIQAGQHVRTVEEIERYRQCVGDEGQGYYRTYLDTGYYLEQLQRYEARFGIDRIHVILMDDFREPEKTLAGVFRFLDVDPGVASGLNYELLNEAPAGKEQQITPEAWNWLVRHYQPYNRQLESYLERSLAMWNCPL